MRGLLYFGLMKWAHLSISALFMLFAIVQWNDPDALIWILMYVVVSGIAFLAFKGKSYLWLNAGVTAILFVSILFYIPDIVDWFGDDMPNIADSMQASSPYIELVREFFGLLISLLAMTFYLVISKKKLS